MRPRSLYKNSIQLVGIVFAMLLGANTVFAQTTSFTYQGRLTDGGTAANGNYDLQFRLFDAVNNGTQQPQPTPVTVTLTNVTVSAGIFTVQLDFGANAFPGANRFLEIGARPAGSGSFTLLTPRQPITSTPYAIRSLNASSADAVTASGTLSANVINTTTQYNLGGSRVLGLGPNTGLNNFLVGLNAGNALIDGRENTFIGSAAGQATTGGAQVCATCGPGGTPLYRGSHSTFVGYRAGMSNTTGTVNSFFGSSAGAGNTTGDANSFFGGFAGFNNGTFGSYNSFFGSFAGQNNTGGQNNSFFGATAGNRNTDGNGNSFFGLGAGHANITGNLNNFFGINSGVSNTFGSENSFFGTFAGEENTTGNLNSFFGYLAGSANSQNKAGTRNTMVGAITKVGSDNLTNATAIGANSQVDQSNSLVLGSIAGVNGATTSVNVGIGTTTPETTLHVVGAALVRPGGVREVSLGTPNGEAGIGIKGTTNRADIRFDGATLKLVAGPGTGPPLNTSGLAVNTSGNVGVGTTSPAHRLSVIGGPTWTSNSWSGAMEFSNASAIGWQANNAGWHFGIGQSNGGLYIFQTSSALGSMASPATYNLAITDGGNVGIGTISPDRKLSVNGSASKAGGGSWDVFSDERLKTIKGRFTPGLKAVMQLQPLRYEYKRDNGLGINSPGEHIGFGAQAVQKIIPEAVSKNDKGYLLINNDPILLSMLNAIKEQQQQIETLRTANTALNERLRTVEKFLTKRRARSSGRRR